MWLLFNIWSIFRNLRCYVEILFSTVSLWRDCLRVYYYNFQYARVRVISWVLISKAKIEDVAKCLSNVIEKATDTSQTNGWKMFINTAKKQQLLKVE